MKNSYEILMDFKPYVDQNIIVQASKDQGDSANRVGTFYALCKMSNLAAEVVLDYEKAIEALTVRPGTYRRSSDRTFWGYNENNFSRDQFSALQLAFAARKDSKRLKESMLGIFKRFGFNQNIHPGTDASADFRKIPDFMHPNNMAIFLRGLNIKIAYPILYFIDLLLFGDLVLRRYADSANDVDNLLSPYLLYANLVMPTFVSKLAMKIYLRTNFMDKIKAYHSPERNGILPFPELIQYAYNVNGFKVKEV